MPKYEPPKFKYKPTYTVPSFTFSPYAKESSKKQLEREKERERLERLREEEELRRLEEYLLQGKRAGTVPLSSARRKDELSYVSPFGQRPTMPNQFVYKPVAKRKKRSAK